MLHHPVTRAPVDTARLLGHILVGEAFSSRLKSPWWQISCGRRVRKRRARRWRPISRWARTWWRVLAPGPRSRRQSRRSKRSPGRKPDKWGCACEREEFEWTNKRALYLVLWNLHIYWWDSPSLQFKHWTALFKTYILHICLYIFHMFYLYFFFFQWLTDSNGSKLKSSHYIWIQMNQIALKLKDEYTFSTYKLCMLWSV